MTSESDISRIYDELESRMQHIGIALLRKVPDIKINETYDLGGTDTPTVGETEYAFLKWNCAILTAFRGSTELTPEENFERNKKRNELLRKDLVDSGLMFRSVKGCYREAGMDEPDTEICFFVTNDKENKVSASDFFRKVYRCAEKYEQDSFLFTFPGANRVAFLIATNDNGRQEFRDDIRFAGPLFTHVPDWNAWTDCSDGRISFRLVGMIMMGGTGNRCINFGEGDIFDVDSEGYEADGLVIIRGNDQYDLKEACHNFKGKVPLIERYFMKNNLTAEEIHGKVTQALTDITKKKSKRIGFHCSAALDGSYIKGASVAFEAVKSWAIRNRRKFQKIAIVDIYGDYSKI